MTGESLLSGLKVIDCASYIAAPLSTSIMAEWGADVVKIEPPGAGDPFRQLRLLPGMPISDIDYASLMENRSKRGLALDLSTAAGQDVVHRLVAQADIFVTNLPLRVRDKLHIDYDTLAALNSRLIYGSFTGFGEVGPEAAKPGFDATAYWARSGIMDTVRPSADAEPSKGSVAQGDHPAAVTLFAAVMSALYRRERTGKGMLVRSSLMANGMWDNGFMVTAALNGAQFVPRAPRSRPANALSTLYQTSDERWLLLTLLNEDRYWPILTECLQRPELVTDPRFGTKPDRLRNSPELFSELQATFLTHDRDHWQRVLHDAGIVFEIVATPDDLAHDEQARLNGVTVEVPGTGGLRTVSTPFSLDDVAKVPLRPAPGIGEHTDEILTDAGFSTSEIAALRSSGTVA